MSELRQEEVQRTSVRVMNPQKVQPDDEMEIELRCSKKEKKAECVKHKQMLEGETYVIYYYGSCNDIYDTGVTVNYKSKENEESSEENENNQNNKTEEITIDDNNKNDESESNNHINYISINIEGKVM